MRGQRLYMGIKNRRRWLAHTCAVVLAPVLVAGQALAAGSPFDTVILNGLVMDPETGFEEIANVGIRDGRIAEISDRVLEGVRSYDATGLVVAPGFIDLHAHIQTVSGQGLQALDGVTTALEQENGVYPVAPFYAAREGRARIHFGASVGHQGLRIKVKTDIDAGHASTNDKLADRLLRMKEGWAEAAMTDAELEHGLSLFRKEIADGGLGLGLSTEYVPGADRREVYQFMKAAAEEGVAVFTHVRAAYHADAGGLFEMMQEVLANTASTGGALHICHVTSKGLNDTALILDAISGAHKQGMDVSTEVYPYTAGSTMLGSALFNDGWKERWNATYSDIEWPATGERLTAETFYKYREEHPATFVIFHMIPESAMNLAIAHPLTMIASDGVKYINGRGHPRGAGTFARVLGVHAREKGDVSLMEALRKMTLLPAQRMGFVPMMQRKGRIQEGMDADITIFDPETVRDRATYQDPMRPSMGIVHVLVAGTAVVVDGVLQEDAYPGQGIRFVRGEEH